MSVQKPSNRSGGLLTSIFDVEDWRSPPSKTSIKIVILGDGATGKTSYFTRLISGDTDDYMFRKTYDATRGCNICQIEYAIGKYEITVHLFDTAGQEKFGALRDSYLMGADGVILMYDLTDNNTKRNVINKWIPEIKRIITSTSSSSNAASTIILNKVPIAVVGNKNDRIDVEVLRCNDPKRHELDDIINDQILTNTIGIRKSVLQSIYDSHVFGQIEHFYVSVKGDENLINPINWLLCNILSYYIPVDAKKTDSQPKTMWCNNL